MKSSNNNRQCNWLVLLLVSLIVLSLSLGFLYQLHFSTLQENKFEKELWQYGRLQRYRNLVSLKPTSPPFSVALNNVEDSAQIQLKPDTTRIKHVLGQQQQQHIPIISTDSISTTTPVKLIQSLFSSPNTRTLLLIICSNRPNYLKQTLKRVFKYHPGVGVPIIISEDGNSPEVAQVIATSHATSSHVSVTHIHHHRGGSSTRNDPNESNGYYKLASHFKWALTQAFNYPNYSNSSNDNSSNSASSSSSGVGSSGRTNVMSGHIENVIILEEDLLISPDFFNYFLTLASMLETDTSLLAISAWNDNGQNRFVKDNKQLYRSDFFPGLGWMIHKNVWNFLSPIWPKAYWDDWLREPARRQGRHIIRPEVSRTFHIGVKGVSNSEFGNYLSQIKLNEDFIDFSTLDLSYLDKDKWDEYYTKKILQLPIATRDTFTTSASSEVRMIYDGYDEWNSNSFVSLAHWAGVMDNIKAGVPRTAYKGIVSFCKDEKRVHLTPMKIV